MVGRNREKQTLSGWFILIVGLVLVGFAAWSFRLWSNRDYGQLTTSLITASGVVLTLWMTQVRAIEQLRAEGERDRAQRSIAQRVDLAEKLATAIEHLSSENELKQAAGVQEILFQIDDWHTLIELEIAGIKGSDKEVEVRRNALEQEGLRHRQELFDIAYKFDTENMHVLKSRARGLKQRLREESSYSLVRLDFSGLVVGQSGMAEKGQSRLDLRNIVAGNIVINCAKLQEVDLGNARLDAADLSHVDFRDANLSEICLESADLHNANLEYANLIGANLRSANLAVANLGSAKLWNAHLESVDLRGANLKGAYLKGAFLKGAYLKGALYDEVTTFPEGFDPKECGMVVSDRIDEQ